MNVREEGVVTIVRMFEVVSVSKKVHKFTTDTVSV